MDIDNLQNEIKNYKSIVKFSESLEKLMQNREFQEVIMEGYLKDHALALVKLRHSSKEPDDSIARSIDAVSNLMAYFDVIQSNGATARSALIASEQTLEEHYKEV